MIGPTKSGRRQPATRLNESAIRRSECDLYTSEIPAISPNVSGHLKFENNKEKRSGHTSRCARIKSSSYDLEDSQATAYCYRQLRLRPKVRKIRSRKCVTRSPAQILITLSFLLLFVARIVVSMGVPKTSHHSFRFVYVTNNRVPAWHAIPRPV